MSLYLLEGIHSNKEMYEVSNNLLVLWFVIVYFSPFVMRYVMEELDEAMPIIAIALLVSVGVPTFILFDSGNMSLSSSQRALGLYVIAAVVIFGAAIFWPMLVMSWVSGFDSQRLNPYIVIMYLPPAAFAFYLASINLVQFSLLLTFLIPPVGYMLSNYGDNWYVLFTIPPLFSIFLGLKPEAISLSGVLLLIASLYLLYKHRTRGGEITFGDSRRRPKGFSVVNPKSYPAIPKDAIDPFTHENIHDSIAEGKSIVKCKDCWAYYDEEVWEYYGKTCARDGCSNAGV